MKRVIKNRQRGPLLGAGGRPHDQGLYRFENEHDACGVGMVADIAAVPQHRIVEMGVTVLERLTHRGAAGSDPDTGDGAGLYSQLPDEFFRKHVSGGADLPPLGNYAVAMVFLPREKDGRESCLAVVEKIIAEEGAKVELRREVDVDMSALGRLARETCPEIVQVFMTVPGLSGADLERKCFVIRRQIEKAAAATSYAGDFYVASLSSRSIVYKGLMLAGQMRKFYRDLANEDFKSSLVLVHQRYSTNTFPTWSLAQPFRYLAHNGEINTLRGNLNALRSREADFASPLFGDDLSKLLPLIDRQQSDSASLDNMLEMLVASGRSLAQSMLMLLPQAWGKLYHMSADVRGFFEYHSALMEPWDGPAAVAFSDGVNAGAMLDRNGLRPARYSLTRDGIFLLSSESGVLDLPEKDVVRKGRLGPGEMIYLDLEHHRIIGDREIKTSLARRQPYRRWVDENRISLHGLFDAVTPPVASRNLDDMRRLFGYSREDLDVLLLPMAQSGAEPVGSMGNDASLAVLSSKPQLLFNYFKQQFAQVTNPPIDPIREQLVMSTMTYIGNQGNILEESPRHAHLLKMPHPVLTDQDLERMRTSALSDFRAATLSMGFRSELGGAELERALNDLCRRAAEAVRSGHQVLILSDRHLNEGETPIPSLLATAAVNRYLVAEHLRTSAGLVLETGEVREVAHFALLLGYGATAINPYLALESVVDLANSRRLNNVDAAAAVENYIHAVLKGLLKAMSRLGISTLRSFRGSQTFEAVGLAEQLIAKYFSGTASRVGGIGLNELAEEARLRRELAVAGSAAAAPLATGGQYSFRRDGENHLWTPETLTLFQRAVRNNDAAAYAEYAKFINEQETHLCTLRGMFKFKAAVPVSLDEVEPASEIVKHFVTGAMSYGSISPEAHYAIARAMNKLGGMSNSGEGGEDPVRYLPQPDGISVSSAIKQVASGRFGVTAEYLVNAREIQIKMAQGAKPGEGGQLPGHKVNDEIARVRHSTPGVSLISPPPHHDIYSIEDLAQLIYDLRNANNAARISVKLVSETGVGTVAAGVAKGHANVILISGHDGGTGASPLSSIKHVGMPWEIGLAEAQQTLRINHLRGRIRLQVDGQLKTGRDVMIGALLGAEEFGFATTILVCLGCVMMRKCQANTCPMGVATQDPELRKFFTGKPEYIENFLMFIAEEVRTYMAALGFRKLSDAVGRADMLEMNEAIDFWKARNLDFSDVFAPVGEDAPAHFLAYEPQDLAATLDERLLIPQAAAALERGEKVVIEGAICNVDRTAGTRLSSEVARRYGHDGLPEGTITVKLAGVAGQSFGAFLASGIRLELYGDANDYVGKGLSGGTIAIRPAPESTLVPEENVAAGNVIGYGGISGRIFINGLAGERFCIRNSGITAVAEGVGDHGCEYMTGGRVVILGRTGMNFAAGMTGGIAYVRDLDGEFDLRCNTQSVDLENIMPGSDDEAELLSLIRAHFDATGSALAGRILDNWETERACFVKVFPVEYRKALGRMSKADENAVDRKQQTV
ncbi:MAG: glutamate synthase large subunit [Victivallaceae bacterium]|nr:glutamate synthase large subunit [Victivallaceae bacterium]